MSRYSDAAAAAKKTSRLIGLQNISETKRFSGSVQYESKLPTVRRLQRDSMTS